MMPLIPLVAFCGWDQGRTGSSTWLSDTIKQGTFDFESTLLFMNNCQRWGVAKALQAAQARGETPRDVLIGNEGCPLTGTMGNRRILKPVAMTIHS